MVKNKINVDIEKLNKRLLAGQTLQQIVDNTPYKRNGVYLNLLRNGYTKVIQYVPINDTLKAEKEIDGNDSPIY